MQLTPSPADRPGPLETRQDAAPTDALAFVMRSTPSSAGPGDDLQKPPVLEVAAIWSGTVVDVRHVKPDAPPITGGSGTGLRWRVLGSPIAWVPAKFAKVAWMLAPTISETSEERTSDFFIPNTHLPQDQFELFRWDGTQFICRFSAEWDGFVDEGEERVTFADLIAQRRATRDEGDIYTFPVADGTRVVAELGDMVLLGQMVPDSKRIVAPLTDAVDPVFAGVTSTFAAVFAMLLMVLWTTPVPAGATVVAVNDRVANLVLRQQVPEPPTPVDAAKGPKDDAGAKAKKREGKRGDKKSKQKRAKGKPVSKQQLDQQVVADAGVLGALSDNAAMAAAFGQSALSSDLTGGVGGVLGAKGIAMGSGGLSSRGGGLGSGGTADGFGGLDTKGRGSGKRHFGQGGGEFTKKKSGALGRISGEPIVLGALDKSLIDQVVRRHMNQIRYCYQRQLTKAPDLSGKVTVKFVIARSGVVSKADIKSSSLGNAAVESCIQNRFLRFTFPKPKGNGIVIVSYPFLFSPG